MSERRVVRQRKVSTKIASIASDADRRNAANARLEALETDHDTAPTFQDSDEEFVLEDSDEGSTGSRHSECFSTRLAFRAECAAQMNLSWERAVVRNEAN